MPFTATLTTEPHILTLQKRFLGAVEKRAWKQTMDQLDTGACVVIDLGRVDFIDSTGIGLLIQTAAHVRRKGGDVVIANMKHRVKNLFLMTRLLGNVFADYDSLDEAKIRLGENRRIETERLAA